MNDQKFLPQHEFSPATQANQSHSYRTLIRLGSYTNWLDGLAKWTHAVSFTFRRSNDCFQAVNERIVGEALRHFLHVLDRLCLTKRQMRNGSTVPSAASIGWGTYGDHPHAHLSLEAPDSLSHEEFTSLIERAADKTRWIQYERRINPYLDIGWMKYMVDHGEDYLIVALLRPSHLA